MASTPLSRRAKLRLAGVAVLVLGAVGYGWSKAMHSTPREGSSVGSSEVRRQRDSEPIVYITRTGKKYHRAGCRYLKSSEEVTLGDAQGRGLTPCSACRPPR